MEPNLDPKMQLDNDSLALLMAYDKLAKAVNYALNHKAEFLTYLKDGNVQMQKSDAERSFRIVKKMMRVSLNIGSERAAMNHAFVFSLFETAKLWNLNLAEYLPAVFNAFNSAPHLKLDFKNSEQEQEEKTRSWKNEVRDLIKPVLPWEYAKKLNRLNYFL